MGIRSAFSPMSKRQDPFQPNQVLLERTGPYTYSNILPRGIYDLIIAGGGGEGRSWNFGGVIFHNAGGSGAAWEGQFYNPVKQPVTFYSGNVMEDSFFDSNGGRMITAGRGGNYSGGSTGQPGDGGIISVNGALTVVQQRKAQNGNRGSRGSTGTSPTVSVCSIYNWGQGSWGYASEANWVAGGVRLQYLRRK